MPGSGFWVLGARFLGGEDCSSFFEAVILSVPPEGVVQAGVVAKAHIRKGRVYFGSPFEAVIVPPRRLWKRAPPSRSVMLSGGRKA